MSTEKKTTGCLDEVLKSVRPEKISRYLDENADSLACDDRPFYVYMKKVLKDKGIELLQVYINAGFSQSFGGKLFRGEKKISNRDMAIRLCLAGKFNLDETNRTLKLCGYSPLYSKVKRDAVLIVAVNTGTFDIGEVNCLLRQNGFEELLNS